MRYRLCATSVLMALLAGCGQSGPLYLPGNEQSTKAPRQSNTQPNNQANTQAPAKPDHDPKQK